MAESCLKRRGQNGHKKPFSYPYSADMGTKTTSESLIKAFLLLDFLLLDFLLLDFYSEWCAVSEIVFFISSIVPLRIIDSHHTRKAPIFFVLYPPERLVLLHLRPALLLILERAIGWLWLDSVNSNTPIKHGVINFIPITDIFIEKLYFFTISKSQHHFCFPSCFFWFHFSIN